MDAFRTRTLWMSRSDLLGDPCEGSRPRGDVLLIEKARQKSQGKGRELMQFYADRASLLQMDKEAKATTFISCWQMTNHDMMQMWERYCNPRQLGIAIQTTYARLDSALPFYREEHQNVLLGLVTYADYDAPDFRSDFSNWYSRFMLKKVQYADESEARVLCDVGATSDAKGIRIGVNWGELIERVVVSPYAGDAFTRAAESFCRQHGFSFPVSRSSARDVMSY